MNFINDAILAQNERERPPHAYLEKISEADASQSLQDLRLSG